jgi:ribonuclease VapC
VILDSSAIVAIFLREPGYLDLIDQIAGAELVGVGCPTLAETAVVLEARIGANVRGSLGAFLDEFAVERIEFGDPHWNVALDAYRRFGRGRHPARLNYGDCMSYATAWVADQPLLFVGNDFSQTDLPAA